MGKCKKSIFLFIVLLFIFLFLIIIHSQSGFNKKEQKIIILKDFVNLSNTDKNIVLNNYNSKKVDDNYLFLGDSITDFYDLDKYYEGMPVVNSGVNGNKASDILKNMKKRVYDYNPSKVFLLIGTNQIWRQSETEVYESIIEIVEKIRENRSHAIIYVESIYPVNKNMDSKMVKSRDNSKIKKVNEMLLNYCSKNKKVYYIDLYSYLEDDDGNLKKDYSTDGLHLSDKGYEVVTDVLKKYM